MSPREAVTTKTLGSGNPLFSSHRCDWILGVRPDVAGRRVFVLGYTPDELAPGDYTLRVALGEGADRLESYALLRVKAGS